MKTKIEIVNEVLNEGVAIKVQNISKGGKTSRILLDVQSANLINTVYNAIKDNNNREKFMCLSWISILNFCYKQIA